MLLTHTAGYPEVYASPELTELFGERYDPDRLWSYGLVLDAIDTPRNPTARYRYSNAAYIVLSYILSEASHGPAPPRVCGLPRPGGGVRADRRARGDDATDAGGGAQVHTRLPVRDQGRVATGRVRGRAVDPDRSLWGPVGRRAFAGTALGAAQFLDGLLVRENLLEEATLTQMLQPTEQSVRGGEPYGLGTYTVRAAGSQWQGHDGSYAGYTSMGFTDRAAA